VAVSTCVFCSRFSVRDGAAAQLLPLLFSRDHARNRAREKQREQLGGGAIADGETRAKNASGNGSFVSLKVRFRHHTFATNLLTNLFTHIASQSNVAYFCHDRKSEVYSKPNWFAANSPRRLCECVCQQVCSKHVIVDMHLRRYKFIFLAIYIYLYNYIYLEMHL
jgi:hypothetical protein